MSRVIRLRVNGMVHIVRVRAYEALLGVVRNSLGLTGTKEGCDYGGCGACTVLVGGRAVYSCMLPVMKVGDREVITIEGFSQDGKLHPIQEAFVLRAGFQCGFCTPGMIMSAKGLLDRNSSPLEEDVRKAIVGNLCRCTGYVKIIEAIMEAANTASKSESVGVSIIETSTSAGNGRGGRGRIADALGTELGR